MRLPDKYRHLFSKPMGDLIDDDQVDPQDIARLVDGAVVVTVGDRTTQRMLEYGIRPDIQIVDGMERRRSRTPPDSDARIIRCDNPPAHITSSAMLAIDAAYKDANPVRILVSGEEDLLLVPAMAQAPDGTILMYGQPDKGLVIVKADRDARYRARRLLDLMEE